MSIWPRADAVAGAGGVGVVQVVPRLAHRGDGQRPDVGGAVAVGPGPVADDVADRVDRPGDVVQHRDADEAGPEERGERAPPGHGDQAPEQRRAEQAHHGPQRELPGDAADVAIGEQVGSEAGDVGPVPVEGPSHVRVPEPARHRGRSGAEQPRGVRVALLVGEGVVAAVIGDPGEDVALQGEAPGDRQGVAQAAVGLERAVGEVAVEPGGHAEPGQEVEPDGEPDIEPAQAPPPGQGYGGDERQHRQQHEDVHDQELEAGFLAVEDGLRGRLRLGGRRHGRCGHGVKRSPRSRTTGRLRAVDARGPGPEAVMRRAPSTPARAEPRSRPGLDTPGRAAHTSADGDPSDSLRPVRAARRDTVAA